MPTYEYICSACSHEFEEFQSIKDEPVKVCPSCGGTVCRKISGGAGLLFKGSGFYITDYRSDEYKKAASKDKPQDVKKPEKDTAAKKPVTA